MLNCFGLAMLACLQVTPVPAAAVSTDTDSEGVMASAQAKHALALVLTRVKQLPVRTVPARFNAQLQALAERLGGEWWPHQLELVKQWWGKHWTGLLLANATCKAADSSKGPVDTDFITVSQGRMDRERRLQRRSLGRMRAAFPPLVCIQSAHDCYGV